MSLWFDLRENNGVIGQLVVQRIDNTRVVILDDDDVSTYAVTLDGVRAGTVRHRYGDGAWALVRAALEVAADTQNPARPKPGGVPMRHPRRTA